MQQEYPFSPEKIEAEHQRLGHNLGWRLLTCPSRNIEASKIALITINPGGDKFESPRWSVEDGSAYEIESWKGRLPGEENLQRQIRRMFEVMGTSPVEVLSGYLVPFRSRRWETLSNKADSVRFGIEIWRGILKAAKVKTVIALGKDIAPQIVSLLNANSLTEHPTYWGEQKISRYKFGNDGKLLVLPHLSTFKLFSDQKYENAFIAALNGA